MKRIISVIVAAAVASQAAAQSPTETARVRKVIDDPRGLDAPGCAVGIYRDGKTNVITSGAADVAARRPANGDTLYDSASLAKQFTALAIAQLAVTGKIRLDADIRTYLPEMPDYGTPVTVEMLLHHTSGVPDILALLFMSGYDYDNFDNVTRAEALKLLYAYPSPNFRPGTQSNYSNGGYLLLSEIVEKTTRMKFGDYVRQSILDPLGMKRSFVLDGPAPAAANSAHGYVAQAGTFEVRDATTRFGGAGGMKLSINDLGRYVRDFHTGHKVWTPEVRKIMTEPALYADGTRVLGTGAKFAYASGLSLSKDWMLHSGGAQGFRNLLAWMPDRDIGVALLCNRADVVATGRAAEIIRALDGALPALQTPIAPLPPVIGRYVSPELGVTWDISQAAEGFHAVVTPLGGSERSSLNFKRGTDGSYSSGFIKIAMSPDFRGFDASVFAASVRFTRVPEPLK